MNRPEKPLEFVQKILPPTTWTLLKTIAHTAQEHKLPLYLVGGPLRDVLIHVAPTDVDLAVEQDAIRLAKCLQERFGGDVQTHTRFGTAKWSLSPAVWHLLAPSLALDDAPMEVDLATTRTETYEQPAALPTVAFAPIADDLRRRDFSINALALRLEGAKRGELLDLFNGQADLEAGLVRVLHGQSFVDDPTRIWRAVRFSQRFGYEIEAQTAVLLQNALPYIADLSGERLWYELKLVLQEAQPAATLARLAEAGVLTAVHPHLHWQPETAVSFNRVPQLLAAAPWRDHLPAETATFAYLAAWLTAQPLAVLRVVVARLRLPKREQADLTAVYALQRAVATLEESAPPSRIEQVLRNIPLRVLFATRAQFGDASWQAKRLTQYVAAWRWVKTAVTGDDLRELGLPPGPRYREILNALLAARLDGQVKDERDERQWLAELLHEAGDA